MARNLLACQPPPEASTSTLKPSPSKLAPQQPAVLINGQLVPHSSLETSGGRVKKFACTFEGCDKRYTRPARLEEHLRSHTGERPFLCPHCPSSFGRDSHLKAHVRIHADEEDKKFGCDECTKRFWTNQHLKKHVEVIHKGKTYDCTECNESFRKHHLLRSHIAEVHSEDGTKPFPCEHPGCDKSFTQAVHLKAHLKTHDPSRYLCAHPSCLDLPLASRQFPTWSALQKHSKSAHPPTCPHPECNGKTFTTNRGLKGHLEVHKAREGDAEGAPRKRRRKAGRGRKRGSGGEEETGSEWEERMEGEREERMESFGVGVVASGGEGNKRIRLEADSPWVCLEEGCRKEYKSAGALENHVALKHSLLPPPLPHPAPPTPPTLPAPVPAAPSQKSSSLLDLLTGTNYAPSSTSLSTRKFACPFPGIQAIGTRLEPEDVDSDDEAGDWDEQGECEYWFKRVYDVERHLRSRHGVEVHREELAEWLEEE